MKTINFYNNVSIFSISVGNKGVISKYARNEDLIMAFKKISCENEFPIYSAFLRNKSSWFDAEVEKQRLQNAAAEVLRRVFEFNDAAHQVNQKILSYFRDEDLQFLTEVS